MFNVYIYFNISCNQNLMFFWKIHEFEDNKRYRRGKWCFEKFLINSLETISIKFKKHANNCFQSEKRNTTLGQAKIGKHDCGKITATYKNNCTQNFHFIIIFKKSGSKLLVKINKRKYWKNKWLKKRENKWIKKLKKTVKKV